jgi:hypothetical protein
MADLTFSVFINENFVDWEDTPFTSYLETWYNIPESEVIGMMQAPYIYTFLKQGTSVSDSLLLQGRWDWGRPE